MKKFDFSIFFGCCAISVGIIIAGMMIAERLPETFSGTISDNSYLYGNTDEFEEYLSQYDAIRFLHIDEYDLNKLIESGELIGTYTTINTTNIFSRDRLSEWLTSRMDN